MSSQHDFGKLLKVAWRRSGLTQQELADQVGEVLGTVLTQQTVWNWINGRNLPGTRITLLALCQVLYRTGGISTLEEIDALFLAAEQGALHPSEREQWLPEVSALLSDENQRERPASQEERDQGQLDSDPSAVDSDNSAEGVNTVEPEEEDVPGRGPEPGNPPESEPVPWYSQVVDGVGSTQSLLASPERQGMIGAVAFSAFLIGSTWRSPANSHNHLLWFVLLGIVLWGSTAALALPPTAEESNEGSSWQRHKLYRLSGTACGVFILGSALLWVEALWQLLVGAPLPRGLVFLIATLGAAFAYAAGAHVYRSFMNGPAEHRFYTRASAQVSGMMLLGQAALLAFIYFTRPIWHVTIPLLILVPSTWLLLHSLYQNRAPRSSAHH
ncbi:MAG: helix-turn-helix domain-containing protein [Chloroflexota bacterium]|nr:helix-turn-helix domain-containing protein [Chloroflexota bacterium]